MVYVIAGLLIIAIILGMVQSKKLKNRKNTDDLGCGSGCASCPHSRECGKK